jgi:hypothetical protein
MELEKPNYKLPLAKLLAAIVLIGFGLGFIDPMLAVIGVVLFGYWIYWRYFGWLQCDGCAKFFEAGEVRETSPTRIAWNKPAIKSLVLRASVIIGVFVVIFLPLYYMQLTTEKNCAAECSLSGSAGKTTLNKCKCVPKEKS